MICFHKWVYMDFHGNFVNKDDYSCCLRYCDKCNRREKNYVVVGNERFFKFPLTIQINWKKIKQLKPKWSFFDVKFNKIENGKYNYD